MIGSGGELLCFGRAEWGELGVYNAASLEEEATNDAELFSTTLADVYPVGGDFSTSWQRKLITASSIFGTFPGTFPPKGPPSANAPPERSATQNPCCGPGVIYNREWCAASRVCSFSNGYCNGEYNPHSHDG